MILNELLKEKNLSMYRLSKISGVPQSTISSLCSEELSPYNITVGNALKLAKTLEVSIEDLLQDAKQEVKEDFELYRSNICHEVYQLGQLDFVVKVLESDKIEQLYRKKEYRKSLYLLSMVDYLSRINNLPYCNKYSDIRKTKLKTIYYPLGIKIKYHLTKDHNILKQAKKNAIPEFLIHNIVESEIEKIG